MGDLALLPYLLALLLACLLAYLSVWNHGYLFYPLGCNLIVLSSLAQTVPTLAIGISFS